jgi:hypothetical protein
MNASFPSIVKETRRTTLLPTTTLNRQGKYNCVAKKQLNHFLKEN